PTFSTGRSRCSTMKRRRAGAPRCSRSRPSAGAPSSRRGVHPTGTRSIRTPRATPIIVRRWRGNARSTRSWREPVSCGPGRPPYGETVPWPQTFVFFSDERCVRHDHPESNYRMAQETLLAKVPIPVSQIFPILCEHGEESDAAAAGYARALSEVFGLRRGELPRFDLILLGVGIDG